MGGTKSSEIKTGLNVNLPRNLSAQLTSVFLAVLGRSLEIEIFAPGFQLPEDGRIVVTDEEALVFNVDFGATQGNR